MSIGDAGMDNNAASVSVIVRTFNEEKWIRHCISSIRSQSNVNTEIIVVDSGSTDRTLALARLVGVDKLISIDRYTPGLSLNTGISEASNELVAIISAHCIPYDSFWLSHLVNAAIDPQVVGVYSRQIPLPYTPPSDALDLFITFGTESRIQYSDSFFHNASSLIKRSVWTRFPFDEILTNIEDRIWADTVIDNGFAVAYCSTSIVFHHHGIHQSSEQTDRSLSTASIVKSKYYPYGSILPNCLDPSNLSTVSIISCRGVPKDLIYESILTQYNRIDISSQIHLIHDEVFLDYNIQLPSDVFPFLSERDESLSHAIKSILAKCEASSYVDYVFYLNCDYAYPRSESLSQYMSTTLNTGFDTVACSFEDHATILFNEELSSRFINASLDLSSEKLVYQKVTLGQGTLTPASVARSGNLLDDQARVHLLTSKNILSTIRYSQSS